MPRVPPGFRDSGWRGVAAGGTLHQVGSHGAGWSTKTASNDTYYLRFDCDWLVPQNSSCRAYGLQLRCLQEEGGAAGPRDEASQSPVEPQPSRGEYNSFPLPRSSRGGSYFL